MKTCIIIMTSLFGVCVTSYGQTYYPLYTPGDVYYFTAPYGPNHLPTITWHQYRSIDTSFGVDTNYPTDCCTHAAAYFRKLGFDSSTGFVVLREGMGEYIGLTLPWIPHPAFVRDRMEFIHNVRPHFGDPDTMTFTRYWSADTVIFGVNVRVNYFMVDSGKKVENYHTDVRYFRYVAVADTFGLVWFADWEGYTGRLANATIRGVAYNVVGIYLNTFPLQIGNEWHYLEDVWVSRKEYIQTIDRDTIINGVKYFRLLRKDVHILHSVNAKFDTTVTWLRYDSLAGAVFVDSSQTVYARYNMRYGEYVTDTGGIMYCNIPQKNARYEYMTLMLWDYIEWVDNVGMVLWRGNDAYYERRLLYSKINGVECGAPLTIDDPTEILSSFTLGQNYPNPVSLTAPVTNIPITATHGAATQLILTDMLGREVRRVEVGSGQETASLNVHGLTPGVYWYRIGGVEAQAQKLVIVP